jgi:hypothetical protein
MARRGAAGWGVAMLAGLVLAGCEDPAPRQAAAPAAPAAGSPTGAPQGRPGAALQAAEERLRARLRVEGALTLRAVQAYRQALPDTLAICGQVNPSGRGDEPFLPWVAVVTFAGTTPTRTDFYLAASSQEATRVYFEMVDRCFEGGGPASARQSIRPLPPAPYGLPRSAADAPTRSLPPAAPAPVAAPVPPAPVAPPAAPASTAPAAPARGPAQGMVTTTPRHPVNVRANPAGGSEVVRIVPRGSALQVFGEAPGGWLQVGEAGVAWGWLHNSLIER